jgi:biopolymer transport protein ExbD
MISFGAPPPRRRPNLTPMIDVVFLLVVFFMLASRFGAEGTVALGTGGGSAAWPGPPRLIDLRPEGVALNGATVAEAALAGALVPLMTAPEDPVLLRPAEGVSVQSTIDLIEALAEAGITTVLVVAP